MIDLKQIMQDLPVQNFIKKNFNKNPHKFEYKIPSIECVITDNTIQLYHNDVGEVLYISLSSKYPSICYWATDVMEDWDVDLKSTRSNSDLFQEHIQRDMFGLDIEFVEYSRLIYLKVLKEFFPWKYENPFEK